MKTFRLLLAALVLCSLTGAAHAYRINVLDPVTIDTITPSVLAGGINVSFSACDAVQLHEAPGTDTSGYGCYSAYNETGSNITSLELIFDKTGVFTSGFACGQDNIGNLSFTNVTCSEGRSQIALFFSGGAGIPQPTAANNYAYFTIYVSDLPAGTTDNLRPGDPLPSIPPAAVSTPTSIIIPAGASPTPEPGSIALLSTGLASVGAAAYRKRRWFGDRS